MFKINLCLCAQEFPITATEKKLKDKLQRYWEKFWLSTIGMERLSVYKASLRTNYHRESYQLRLIKHIVIRSDYWVFLRNLNRFLEINDISIVRLVRETPIS